MTALMPFSIRGRLRHQVTDGIRGIACGEPGKRFDQPHVQVDNIEFAALDQHRDDYAVVAAFVETSEQSILSVESEGMDRTLDDVAVEVDAAIGEEVRQAIPRDGA